MTRQRSRRNERGYALITAIVLAVLYFGLMQLMLMESSRELAEARRFRARIVALTYAENAIELAAAGIAGGPVAPATAENDQGTMQVTLRTITGSAGMRSFVLAGRGVATGAARQEATARIWGRIDDHGSIVIEWSEHSQ
jgi:Tfp pilus assembly protein PilX